MIVALLPLASETFCDGYIDYRPKNGPSLTKSVRGLMKNFEKYVTERDANLAPLGDDTLGTRQVDPDKPQDNQELFKAFEEIIDIARRALRQKEDADKAKGKDSEPKFRIAKPQADGAGDPFGHGDDNQTT